MVGLGGQLGAEVEAQALQMMARMALEEKNLQLVQDVALLRQLAAQERPVVPQELRGQMVIINAARVASEVPLGPRLAAYQRERQPLCTFAYQLMLCRPGAGVCGFAASDTSIDTIKRHYLLGPGDIDKLVRSSEHWQPSVDLPTLPTLPLEMRTEIEARGSHLEDVLEVGGWEEFVENVLQQAEVPLMTPQLAHYISCVVVPFASAATAEELERWGWELSVGASWSMAEESVRQLISDAVQDMNSALGAPLMSKDADEAVAICEGIIVQYLSRTFGDKMSEDVALELFH